MKKLANTLACTLLLGGSLPAVGDSLTEIYNLALENDPQLRAARAEYRARREAENIGRAGLLPQISASAEYQESDEDRFNRSQFVLGDNLIISGTEAEEDSDQTVYSVSLEQPLFDLPAWYDFKEGKAVGKQARVQFAADQQELILRVSEAYFNVLRARENLNSAITEQEAIGRQLEQTQQRYEVGLVPITDVHEAQSAYDDATVTTLELRGALNVAFEALEVLTGNPHERLAGLVEKFPVKKPVPAAREEWVDFSLENNLQLEIAELARKAAGFNATARKSEHLPTITGSYSYTDREFDSTLDGTNLSSGAPINIPTITDTETQTVAVRLSVPIFTGGLVSAQRRQAYQQYVAAEENLLATRRNTVQDARSAHLRVITNAARVRARKQAITSAESALEATRAGYEVGTRNIVDVLLAERTLHQARRNYANARYDYIASTLDLKRVAGQLSPDDIYQLNAWLDPSIAIEPASGVR